ncbi:protein argonaute 5-like [Pyrus ussuriensis x Pyrus communis]|uniref:Protein argonaute 5-like n=1 Tax=Pyrus ussuriensis x Pyrus communis TaxID=2448454 RepID=A0A5N5GLZ5_9ROSA|nr:protein argonaute 5-like [Pyrus ussuriensis x Pyrus communis]
MAQTPVSRGPAPAQSSSSSAPLPTEALLICDMEQKLTLTAPCTTVVVEGRQLSITPGVASKKTNKDVIKQLVKLYRESHLGKRIPAYDGMKSIYIAGPLPFASEEFVVKLAEGQGSGAAGSFLRDQEFKVTLKLASKPDLHQLQQFLRSQQHTSPQDRYTVVGRSFFARELGQTGDFVEGLECWRGFYQSPRLTQSGLSLNIGEENAELLSAVLGSNTEERDKMSFCLYLPPLPTTFNFPLEDLKTLRVTLVLLGTINASQSEILVQSSSGLRLIPGSLSFSETRTVGLALRFAADSTMTSHGEARRRKAGVTEKVERKGLEVRERARFQKNGE